MMWCLHLSEDRLKEFLASPPTALATYCLAQDQILQKSIHVRFRGAWVVGHLVLVAVAHGFLWYRFHPWIIFLNNAHSLRMPIIK
jgi:UDP-N-acetylmuramyl pentapeptide phosphotransferase/UDP-N-acetylglucosamine-1-phosphate transferase